MGCDSTSTAKKAASALVLAILLAGCSTFGAAGPGTGTVRSAEGETYEGTPISVIELDRIAIQRIQASQDAASFAQVFGSPELAEPTIERGDVVGVTIWEAPPAVLFGSNGPRGRDEGFGTAQNVAIPDLRVDTDGRITVPFVGPIEAAGQTPSQIQAEITARLAGRANDPQVLVRILGNRSSTVTVLGEVASTRRVPLSASGERVLDVLAEAGGPRHGVEKTTLRLARGAETASMALDDVILDPSQNVPLQANDVLTVIHQPYSFIALGAVARNAEIAFEGSGLSLAQALGRIGGLRDDRADIRGVFVFRFETREALEPAVAEAAQSTQDGRIPVIYRLDLSDASGLFIAQDFAIRDDDVLYVSSAPGADLQKFLSTLSNVALSTIAISNSL